MNKIDRNLAVTVGKLLRASRRSKDITIERLASKMGIDPGTITKYEKGQINITLSRFVRWCKALKVDSKAVLSKAVKAAYRR